MDSAKLAAEVFALALLLPAEHFFPFYANRKNRLRHGLRNFSLGLLGFLFVSLAFSSLLASALDRAQAEGFGLLPALGASSPWNGLLAFVLFDGWMYAWHRANHRVPALWALHRTHHSDPDMDATTAFRFHPGEIALSFAARLLVAPLLGLSAAQLLAYEAALQPVILFHHSNAALPERWDRLLRAIIVTPNMHRVHHSLAVSETNSNYSSVFSFWDRAARTFRLRPDARTIQLGLAEFSEPRWQTLGGMLMTPFARVPSPRDASSAP